MNCLLRSLSLLSLLTAFACSDDSPSGGGSTAGSGGIGQGGSAAQGTPAANCPARCEAAAKTCQQPSSQCTSLCASISEAQLVCLESSGCDQETALACLQGGSGGSNAGGSNNTGGKPNTGGSTGTGGQPNTGGSTGTGGQGGNVCDSVGKKCLYDDFFSESCQKLDPQHPYYVTCYCNPDGAAALDCVKQGDLDCCAKKP